jgi:hypothetical protein
VADLAADRVGCSSSSADSRLLIAGQAAIRIAATTIASSTAPSPANAMPPKGNIIGIIVEHLFV